MPGAAQPPGGKKGAKAAKRQHYMRLQAKRRRKDPARGMQKLATQHARLLLRALKTAKNLELAKASRRIKSAAEDKPGGENGNSELATRREAIKTIAVPELLAVAVETHHLELLVEHSPKQFETPSANDQEVTTEGDTAAKQTKFFREQAVRKIVGVKGVTKVVEDFQRGTLALIAAEEADRSKGAKRKRPPLGSGANSIAVDSGSSGNAVSQFVGSLNSGAADGSGDDEDAELFEAMARRDGTAKNRRGQKARQKIAEKKHGQHAKHILKAKQKEAELAAKRAEARAAVDAAAVAAVGKGDTGATEPSEENRKQKRARLRAEGKLAVRIGTDGGGENNVAAVIAKAADAHAAASTAEESSKKKKRRKSKGNGGSQGSATTPAEEGEGDGEGEGEVLHPSWAAKRQAKAVAPAGTRIVFD
eukprot:COSAG02_NODE_9801_length_2107_cov_1.388944_1_plen_420_part_00